eukprot:CAMPEP_0170524204 /NCGR_PEP_ID=MMETSP0209-20121228/9615_1 /TAXON_ID=665100 ORGANISM="Litonotus pictus, Strain P1" /NCGR_SAMPLE_ID=MMETSP0209 /ASSEMBLY_ACC=CAM_ASM_000301 /LENGTH=199 /DNA_ID=CAMNT_0010812731 /DNA_START=564 /DNA_END=1159 /DNA_ORIENTATION=-
MGFDFYDLYIKLKLDPESTSCDVIKLSVWDTCGMEKFRSLISGFYKNAELAVIVYAVDDLESFQEVDSWMKDLKTFSSPDIKVFVLGNKSDLGESGLRAVKESEAMEYFESNEVSYFSECSALSGDNTVEVFKEAAYLLYNNYSQNQDESLDSQSKTMNSNFSNTRFTLSKNSIHSKESNPVRKGCFTSFLDKVKKIFV